jgi:hypothetical protein
VLADSAFAAPIHHLVTLYARQGRRDSLRAIVRASAAVGLEGATADYIRWRSALALGERALETAALDSMATETIGWIGMISQDDGVDRRLGEHALRLRHARPSTREERFERHLSVHAVALNAGRPREAAALSESIRDLQPDSAFHLRLRILSALYGDGDRLAAERAVETLGTVGTVGPSARLNACILEQWRRLNGEVSSAASTEVAPPAERAAAADQSAAGRLCAATVDAMRMSGRRDPAARQAIGRLDGLLRSGLAELYFGDGHLDYGPIALARLLEATGDSGAALAAVRRRPYFIGWQPFLAASLLYEGRLAAAAGDRAGAIRAYEHYLALRHDPEPPLRAAADSVRTVLAALRVTS